MTPAEVRNELRRLLKDVSSRTISLDSGKLRLGILETMVRALELEQRIREGERSPGR